MKAIDQLPENLIDNLHIQIGKNVKKAREDKDLTQLELSQVIGHKSVTIISRAEIYYKKQHFNVEHLVKIAYTLEVDLMDFFKEIDMSPNS